MQSVKLFVGHVQKSSIKFPFRFVFIPVTVLLPTTCARKRFKSLSFFGGGIRAKVVPGR